MSQPNTHRNRQLVVNAICHAFEISEEQLCSRSRRREVASARQMYYKVTRDYLGMTLKAIGCSLRADRPAYDHTTVMHSIRLVNDLMSVNDQNVIQRYEQVMSFIRQKSDKISTIMVKAGMDDMQKLMTYLQREEIAFTVLESVILQQTKNESNGTEQAGDD